MYIEHERCRNCKGVLISVLNLGNIYPSNFISVHHEIHRIPLILSRCDRCGLVQLRFSVDADLMYRKYWYKSGINKEMVSHLQKVVNSIENLIELKFGDTVVDIGCNDGTMLSLYKNPDIIKIGYDPAYNLAEEAQKNCDYFINNYFSYDYYPVPYKAKVVTAIAMIYDLEDPNNFIKDVLQILDNDGIFVIQFADLVSMLKTNDFPTICHEHIEYYSLSVIKKMLENHGLSLFKVDRNAVNGGSLRLYLDWGKRDIHKSVQKELDYENEIYTSTSLGEFSERIENIKNQVVDFIHKEKSRDKTISILGASTKGNTILQYFGLDNRTIDRASDANKEKWGLKTVGTNIPIVSDEEMFKYNPDYLLILPWFFLNDFIAKYYKYLIDGGIFIVPLPEPRLITGDGPKTLDGKALNNDRFI